MRLSAAILLSVVLWPAAADAKKTEVFRHTYEQVWGAAIRLIRVDQGYPIKDRDEGVGYFLFDYQDDGRTYPGSVELIRIEGKGAPEILVVMQIPAMPSYIERMLLDKLGKKLGHDYGQPPPPPSEEPEDPPPSEGE